MDVPWGSDIAFRFITNVGLVTSNGPHGHNIMACEWTHHLSYKPALIGIAVHKRHATYENIQSSGEFGICLASSHQQTLASLAGRDSGKTVDKIKIAGELGFSFSPAKRIKVLLADDSSVRFECKLMQEITTGDHVLFIGEVLEAALNELKKPLAYHQGKYWDMQTPLEKPSSELHEKVKLLFEKYKRQ